MIAERICYTMARVFRKFTAAKSNHSERSKDRLSYFMWQYRTSFDHYERYMNSLDMDGKRVLDLGCGTGGRTCFFAAKHPSSVVGIDINKSEVEIAEECMKSKFPELADRVRYMWSSDGRIPLPDGSVDTIVMVDMVEHLKDAGEVLADCARVLAPGGRLWFGTIGWYHYNAAHISGYIPIPWCQVFFSDRTLINTIVRITSAPDYKPNVWDREDGVMYRWRGLEDLSQRPGEYLNKITIRQMKQLIHGSEEFEVEELRIHGYSGSRLKFMKAFNLLVKLPSLNELFHSYVSATLRRT